MSRTGLRTITSRHAFVKGVKLLRSRWSVGNMTTDKRSDYLVALANRCLAMYKVPAVTPEFVKQSGPFSAEFDHEAWCLNLDSRGFSKNTAPSVNEMAELADSVYHECRHAEQWFLVCRLIRTWGETAKYLTDLGISAKPAKKAGSVALSDGSEESKLALRLVKSLLVPKGRDRIIQSQEDLDIFSGRKNATQQQIIEARSRLINLGYIKQNANLRQIQNASHRAYQFQFPEADAWDTGRLVKRLYTQVEKKPAPPPRRR